MTKSLFNKYLQGNCTEEEFEQILAWIREGALSFIEKATVQEIWEEFEPNADPYEKEKYNRILDKIHHQININQNSNPKIIQKTSARRRILSILYRAAAILLLPVLVLLLYNYLSDKSAYTVNLNDLEVEVPAGSRMHLELGDGTKVWLNHGSKLKYPYRFKGKNRKVFLTGEGFFEVAHNTRSPFIVGTNFMEVMATGTAFNVSAYQDDNIVETTLVEGKVILFERKNNNQIKALSLEECLKFNLQKNSYSLETENTEKYTAWKDGLLVFRNDPIEVVAKKLGRWYNIEVEIQSKKIKGYPCTATFTDETLPQVLELLSLATPLDYKIIPSKKLPDRTFSKQKVIIGFRNPTNYKLNPNTNLKL